MKPTLLILAAGMGSRYGGLKQIDRFGPHGESLIDYSIYDAKKAGFGKVVYVIRKEFEDSFREKFAHIENHMDVDYVFQDMDVETGVDGVVKRAKPRGTAHAMLCARGVIDEPFAVISADDYYGPEAFVLLDDFLTNTNNKDESLVVCYQLGNTLSPHGTVNRGVCYEKNGYLSGTDEVLKIGMSDGRIVYPSGSGQSELSSDTLVAMLMYGLQPRVLDYIYEQFPKFVEEHKTDPKAEFLFPVVLNEMIEDLDHQCQVVCSSDAWYGVTNRNDKERVSKAFSEFHADGRYPQKLW